MKPVVCGRGGAPVRPLARTLVVAVLVSSMLSSCVFTPRGCTLVGCASAVELRLPVADPAAIEGATLVVCQETASVMRCSEVVLPMEPDGGPGSGYTVSLIGDLHGGVTVWGVDAGVSDLVTSVNLGTNGLPSPDRYTVALRSANDVLVAEAAYDVTYRRVYPNGEDCDDGCVQGDAVRIP